MTITQKMAGRRIRTNDLRNNSPSLDRDKSLVYFSVVYLLSKPENQSCRFGANLPALIMKMAFWHCYYLGCLLALLLPVRCDVRSDFLSMLACLYDVHVRACVCVRLCDGRDIGPVRMRVCVFCA